jgi:hypothetical protein
MEDHLSSYHFGSGRLLLADPAGLVYEPADLGDISFDFKGDKKSMPGSMKFPRRTTIIGRSIEGKASAYGLQGALLASILGGTRAVGRRDTADELITIAATVSPAHVGTDFVEPLYILDAAGQRMSPIASAPTVGQYVINLATGATKGQLTLNAAEPTGQLRYVYRYNETAGEHFVIANGPVSAPTKYRLVIHAVYEPPSVDIELLAVTIDTSSINLKAQDASECSFSFSAEPDANGDVMRIDYGKAA